MSKDGLLAYLFIVHSVNTKERRFDKDNLFKTLIK